MRTTLLLVVVLLAFIGSGCGTPARPPAVTSATSVAPAALLRGLPDDAECSLETPLVPGVPGSPGNLIVSPRNPNGDSELAFLMRLFIEDLHTARAQIAEGATPAPLYPRHRQMRCAWPTKPDERNQRFDALAQGYLAAVRAFDAAPSRARYNDIVNGCIACHSNACGGPLDFIDTMKW